MMIWMMIIGRIQHGSVFGCLRPFSTDSSCYLIEGFGTSTLFNTIDLLFTSQVFITFVILYIEYQTSNVFEYVPCVQTRSRCSEALNSKPLHGASLLSRADSPVERGCGVDILPQSATDGVSS